MPKHPTMTARLASVFALLCLALAACSSEPPDQPWLHTRFRISPQEADARFKELSVSNYSLPAKTHETHWQAWRYGVDYGVAFDEALAGGEDGLVVMLWTRQYTDATGSLAHGADAILLAILHGEANIARAINRLPDDLQIMALDSLFGGSLDYLDDAIAYAKQSGLNGPFPATLKDLPTMFPQLWKRWASATARVQFLKHFR